MGMLEAGLESDAEELADCLVYGLRATERLGALFEVVLDVVSRAEPPPPLEELVGADVTVTLSDDGLERRRFAGVVLEASELGPVDGRAQLRLVLAPKASALSFVQTQEIFLDVSLPELLREKLSSVGLAEGTDFELRLSGTFPKRELVAQYRETDLAFVSRLAEHHGVTLFCEARDGAPPILVFTDHTSGFQLPEDRDLRFRGGGEHVGVFELASRVRAVPRHYAIQDYNYRTPLVDVVATEELPGGYGGGVGEYGTHAKTVEEAQAFARLRAEEAEARRVTFEGRSVLPGLAAGARYRVVDHPRHDRVELLVTEVEHTARFPLGTGGGKEQEARYENAFRAVPTTSTYRPPRVTPRPRIHGFVTGVVQHDPNATAPVGEAARLDDQGRYWVTFHFDTASPDRPRTSRPIRMAQDHVGPGFGTHFPLLPGVEVLIGFADGDPDRPVILGAVPNAVTPSPVTSANANRARIRTASGAHIAFGGK